MVARYATNQVSFRHRERELHLHQRAGHAICIHFFTGIRLTEFGSNHNVCGAGSRLCRSCGAGERQKQRTRQNF